MKQKRKFSSFTLDEAYGELNLKKLTPWRIEFESFAPTDFFYERLRRLGNFGLYNSERARELMIDAFFEEAVERHQKLRIWKASPLESDNLRGAVDYLIAPRFDIVETPLVCVAEAKRDDFIQGLAQCLVEMKACQWNNRQAGKPTTVFGVVSNGVLWQFYKMTDDNEVFGTEEYSARDEKTVLGILNRILSECEQNL